MWRCMVLKGSSVWCEVYNITQRAQRNQAYTQQQQQWPLLLLSTFARNQHRMSRRNRNAHFTAQGGRRLMPTRIAIRGDGSQQKDDARLTRLRVRLRREPMFGVGGAGCGRAMGQPFIDAQDFFERLGVGYRITSFYYTLLEDAVQTLPVTNKAEHVNMMLE
jgi:hypothetical protein